MARRLARLGDKTTYGYVASATSSIIDGKKLALNGDRVTSAKGCSGLSARRVGGLRIRSLSVTATVWRVNARTIR